MGICQIQDHANYHIDKYRAKQKGAHIKKGIPPVFRYFLILRSLLYYGYDSSPPQNLMGYFIMFTTLLQLFFA